MKERIKEIKIMGYTFEVENVPYEEVTKSKQTIKTLTCCCCGELTKGRQWWNRDTGFGLCSSCAVRISNKEGPEYMKECYGEKGIHYQIENSIMETQND